MMVGAGVGRWRFTLRALGCLVAEPATEVTFAAKSRSGAKLHWHIIIARVGYVNRNGYRASTLAPFVNDVSLCKCQADLLSHLHSCLQIGGSLRTNASLNATLQTVKEPKQGFCLINVHALSISFGKPNNIIRNRPPLSSFRQCLACLECIIRRLEVIK